MFYPLGVKKNWNCPQGFWFKQLGVFAKKLQTPNDSLSRWVWGSGRWSARPCRVRSGCGPGFSNLCPTCREPNSGRVWPGYMVGLVVPGPPRVVPKRAAESARPTWHPYQGVSIIIVKLKKTNRSPLIQLVRLGFRRKSIWFWFDILQKPVNRKT